jgi:peptidylprolyl isomerase
VSVVRKRKVLAGLLLPSLLALSACGSETGSGGDEPEPTEESTTATAEDCIKEATGGGGNGSGKPGPVTDAAIEGVAIAGKPGAEPNVKVDFPLEVTETETVVRAEGDGPKVPETATVTVQYAGYNARTGKSFDSSWTSGQPATFALTGVIPGFSKAIQDQSAGSQVVVAMTAEDGYGEQGSGEDIQPGDALIFVIDIVSFTTVLEQAAGTVQEAPATIPQVQLSGDCIPTGFEAGDEVPDEVTESTSTVLVEGAGAKVESGQQATVHYLGQLYPDGDIFDQSWDKGQPATFPIGVGQVIPCWDNLVVGATIGSRLELICTPEDAYGPEDYNGIPGDSTLTFVVDILAAE